jgi:serine/threonine protein kinase
VDEAMPLISQALEGLHYAHSSPIPKVRLADGSYGPGKGLVHRDIKPSNLLLHGRGENRILKVGDYGMAKAFDQAGCTGLTRPGTMAGSCGFMPRQQLLDYISAQPEVDVWAIAATLYYMLTGTTPRDFPGNVDPLKVVLQSEPIPILKRNRTLPKRLAGVIDEALQDSPRIRVNSIAAFKRQLERSL